MAISAVTDHVSRGLSRLIEQYKGKPRLEAYVRSFLKEVQTLSDAAWVVLVSRLIDDAVGEQLTVLGRLVGQGRVADDDERFRVIVRARIAVNRSHGHIDDIIVVAKLLFAAVPFTLTEFFPHAMVLTIGDSISFIPNFEHAMLEAAAAAGVRIDVHFAEDDPEDLFMFGEGGGWGVGKWAGAVSLQTRA